MKKIEYLIVDGSHSQFWFGLMLKEAQKQGWEVIGNYQKGSYAMYLLKREVPVEF